MDPRTETEPMETYLPTMNPEVARLRRLAAQRKLRKRLRQVRLLWAIIGALVVVLLFEVLAALLFSPRFWVYRITTTGMDTLTAGEVIRLMHVPAHSNYYRTSLRTLASRISAEPRVAAAVVKRGAIGVLTVDIQERQAVCQVGETIPPLYLDAAGYVFTRPAPPDTPVPVVEGLKAPAPKAIIGKRFDDAAAATVLACLAQLRIPTKGVALDITRIVVADNGWINLVLRQGTLILIGAPDELPVKAWCIKQAIIQASSEGHALEQVDYINVRVVNKETGMGPTFHVKHDQVEEIRP
ncbi:MAG TPA: FtsQ-type POTRA domain-containing protein [Armatimonadota bacterium]